MFTKCLDINLINDANKLSNKHISNTFHLYGTHNHNTYSSTQRENYIAIIPQLNIKQDGCNRFPVLMGRTWRSFSNPWYQNLWFHRKNGIIICSAHRASVFPVILYSNSVVSDFFSSFTCCTRSKKKKTEDTFISSKYYWLSTSFMLNIQHKNIAEYRKYMYFFAKKTKSNMINKQGI